MATVHQEITIDAPVEQVWAVLADFGGVSKWNPMVSHSVTTSDDASGVGCVRTCEVSGMGRVTEEATEWVEGESLSVTVEGAPMLRSMSARMAVQPEGSGTRATMDAEFTVKFGPIGAVMAAVMMKPKLASTMREALGGLKHYVETGRKIGEEASQASSPSSS